MGHLLDALSRAYDALGFPQATGHDEVFRQLVLARIIEPASKQDSLRVLEEAGAPAPSYPTLNRRLPVWAQEAWRQGLSEACAAHARLGPASLVLYDVSTLYFEADQRRRVPRARVLQGTPPGAADHHRPADRAGRVPAHGLRVRGQQGRDQDDAAGHRGVHGRPPAARRHRRRGRGDDLRGEPEGDRGRRAVVHPRHEDPRRPLPGRAVAPGAPGRGHPRRARLHPALARRAVSRSAATR